MPTIGKILGGRKARAEGEIFEHMVERLARIQGLNCTNIPQGSKMVRGLGGMNRIAVKTPFDFVIGKAPHMLFIDTKSVGKGNFTYADLKEHQIHGLLNWERAGYAAGYLVWFRTPNRVQFFSATELFRMRPRESFTPDDGVHIGNVYTMDLRTILHPQATKGETDELRQNPAKGPRG